MFGPALKFGWDTCLVALSFASMLLVGIFPIDATFVAVKRHRDRQHPASSVDEKGNMIPSDPDGRPFTASHPQ
jgi:hypothetical protein